MTKSEFDKKIENGITAPICQEIGAYRIGFYPFELNQTAEEEELADNVRKAKHDYDEIITTKGAVEMLLEERFTQVYKGIKYYFNNGHDLQKFCEMLEEQQ